MSLFNSLSNSNTLHTDSYRFFKDDVHLAPKDAVSHQAEAGSRQKKADPPGTALKTRAAHWAASRASSS